MARLPTVGGDAGNWGDVLNDYLSQSHNADGSLKTDSVGAPQLKPNSVTTAAIGDGQVTNSKVADAAVGTNQLSDGAVTNAKLAGARAANGVAILDASAKLSESQVPDRLKELELETAMQRAISRDWVQGYFESTFRAPNLIDIPTITTTTSMTTTLSSPVVYTVQGVGGGSQVNGWDGQSDANIRFWPGVFQTRNGANNDLGLVGELKPGGASQAARWPLVFEIQTASAQVEIAGYALAQTSILIDVDGVRVDEASWSVRSGAGSYTALLTFSSSRSRTIRIYNAGELGLNAIRVATGQTITKPPAGARIAVIGDSWVNGASGTGMFQTFAYRVARMLGGPTAQIILAGIGGTGWTAGPAGAQYADRIPAVLAMTPETIIFYGSQNDGATSVEAAVNNALGLVDDIPRVILIPTLWNAYAPQGEEIRLAAASHGREFVDVRGFIYGSGSRATPTGDGNRDYFMVANSDLHMTRDGHIASALAVFKTIASSSF